MKANFNATVVANFLIVVSILMYSCEPNQFALLHPEAPLTIEVAQNWFSNFQNDSKARLGNNDADFVIREMFWSKAYTFKFKATWREIVIVPLVHIKKNKYKSGYKEAWIYRDDEKKIQIRVIEYLQSTGKQNYEILTRQNLTGAMVVRDWDDNFLTGFSLVTGIIKQMLVDENNVKKNKTKNGRISTLTCIEYFTGQDRYDFAYMPAYATRPEEGTYRYTVNSINHVCFWSDGFHTMPWTDTWTALDPATAVQSQYPAAPIADFNQERSVVRKSDMCEIYRFVTELTKWLQKEVHGVILSDGSYLVLPTKWTEINTQTGVTTLHSNTLYESTWAAQSYKDVYVNGVLIYQLTVDLDQGKVYMQGVGNEIKDIVGTFHTHPQVIGPNWQTDISNADKTFAANHPTMQHFMYYGGQPATQYNANGALFGSVFNSQCRLVKGL